MTYTLTELEIARAMKAVAEPTRLQVIQALTAGPLAQKELQAFLAVRGWPVDQSTLAYHMRKLCRSGLVDRQARGVWAMYSLVPGMFTTVAEMLRAGVR